MNICIFPIYLSKQVLPFPSGVFFFLILLADTLVGKVFQCHPISKFKLKKKRNSVRLITHLLLSQSRIQVFV